MQHSGMKRLEGLQPDFREKIGTLLTNLACNSIYVCVVCGLRTIAEQDKLYDQGRSAIGSIVTNAKGGQSAHNFGSAVDLCPLGDNGELNWSDNNGFKAIGEEAEKLGLVWGGHFKSIMDKPHIESSNWKELQQLWKTGAMEVP